MDSKGFGDWLPLESNTTAINNYIQKLGASEMLAYFDVVSLDEDGLLYTPQPVLAGLFTFPTTDGIKNHKKSRYEKQKQDNIEIPSKLYFMKQTAQNACGTIGILHALLHIYEENTFLFKNDNFVGYFLKQTEHMDAAERADFLKNCKSLNEMHVQAVHDPASAPVNNNSSRNNHHFITYIWKDGIIYELDGSMETPLICCECQQEDFLITLFQVLQENYINKADPGEIEFNLMVLSTNMG